MQTYQLFPLTHLFLSLFSLIKINAAVGWNTEGGNKLVEKNILKFIL